MNTARYADAEGSFSVTLPAGWEAERDEEGGLLVAREDGNGLLHLIPFSREGAEDIDPAEELYAFLEDQEIELEEDEVDDIDLPAGGLLALCEYATEEEDEAIYWLMGVAAGPAQIVFASYSCPVGEEEMEQEVVRAILTSLEFDVPKG